VASTAEAEAIGAVVTAAAVERIGVASTAAAEAIGAVVTAAAVERIGVAVTAAAVERIGVAVTAAAEEASDAAVTAVAVERIAAVTGEAPPARRDAGMVEAIVVGARAAATPPVMTATPGEASGIDRGRSTAGTAVPETHREHRPRRTKDHE